MTDTPWTPGPWAIDPDFCVYSGRPETGHRRDIADVCGGKDMPANARLIAAAPDMAEALERLASYNEDIAAGRINYRPEDHITVARAALAKAKGATT